MPDENPETGDITNAPIEVPRKNKGGRPKKVVPVTIPSQEVVAVSHIVDESGLLTADEMAAIQAEVETAVAKELKAGAREKIKAKFFKVERAKNDPKEELVQFRLDLAEYTDGVTIDGLKYFHNGVYTVRRSQYDVFAEAMFRSAEHQNTIDGKNRSDLQRRLYREKLPGAMIGADGSVTNAPASHKAA